MRALWDVIRHNRADITSARRPIGSFLFIGPSDVGKTFLACTLANWACRASVSAMYCRLSRLFQTLAIGRGDGHYTKLPTQLAKVACCCLMTGASLASRTIPAAISWISPMSITDSFVVGRSLIVLRNGKRLLRDCMRDAYSLP